MSDKYKHIDDEYQFPEEEFSSGDQDSVSMNDGSSAESSSGSSTEPSIESSHFGGDSVQVPARKFPALRNPRVVGTIAVAIIAIIGFKVYHMVANRTHVIAKTPVKVQKPIQSVIAQPNPQVVAQLSQLQAQATQDQHAITQLNNQVSGLQHSLQASSRDNAELNQSMHSMVNQMRQMNQAIQADAKPTHVVVKKVIVPVAPPITYQLKAVLPGRAWILGSNDASTTVRVGDHLKNYGIVQAIEPNRGLVLTSSGKVISFGSDDS